MFQDVYYALSGLGALLGAGAAWRTRNHRSQLEAERLGWERLVHAQANENNELRRECRLLRNALRKALARVKELT